jgi:hypothetical protein
MVDFRRTEYDFLDGREHSIDGKYWNICGRESRFELNRH